MPNYDIRITAYEPTVRTFTVNVDVATVQCALIKARQEIREATGIYSILIKPLPLYGYDVLEDNRLVAHFSINLID